MTVVKDYATSTFREVEMLINALGQATRRTHKFLVAEH